MTGAHAIAAAIDRLAQAIVTAIVLDAARGRAEASEIQGAVDLAKRLTNGGTREG